MSPAASLLTTSEAALGVRATERFFARHPELEARWGEAGKRRCLEDARFHVRFLVAALAVREPAIFVDYTRWGAALLARLGIPTSHLAEAYDLLEEAIAELAPEAQADAGPILDAGREALG